MAKEKEYESKRRCGAEGVSERTGTQDRQESGHCQTQCGRRERKGDRLPQRRGSAVHSPGLEPGVAHRRGKTQPAGRIHGKNANPLQIAALAGWLWLITGCGSHHKPVANTPPPPGPSSTPIPTTVPKTSPTPSPTPTPTAA